MSLRSKITIAALNRGSIIPIVNVRSDPTAKHMVAKIPDITIIQLNVTTNSLILQIASGTRYYTFNIGRAQIPLIYLNSS